MIKVIIVIVLVFFFQGCQGDVFYLLNKNLLSLTQCDERLLIISYFDSRELDKLDLNPHVVKYPYKIQKKVSNKGVGEYLAIFPGGTGSIGTYHRTIIKCNNSGKLIYDSGILHLKDMACMFEDKFVIYLEGIPKENEEKYCPKRRYEELDDQENREIIDSSQ